MLILYGLLLAPFEHSNLFKVNVLVTESPHPVKGKGSEPNIILAAAD